MYINGALVKCPFYIATYSGVFNKGLNEIRFETTYSEYHYTIFDNSVITFFYDVNIPLNKNWNLVSFSHLPGNKAIVNILKSYGDIDYVYRWNAELGEYEYSHYLGDELGWMGDFSEFDRVHGFWIHCITSPEEELNIEAVPEDPSDINLLEGWNLVSWQKTTEENISIAIGDIVSNIDYIYRWNSDIGEYEYSHYLGEELGWMGDFNTLYPGYGYWFHCLNGCVWNV